VNARRYPLGNAAKRIRICSKCGYEFKTKEKPEEWG